MSKPGIECRRCIHYFVTWEPANPHGCRAMGFKSRYLPSLLVFRNSGAPCLSYERKNQVAAPKKQDLK